MPSFAGLFLLLLFYSEVKGTNETAAIKAGEPFSLAMLIALLMLLCADAIRGLYLPLVFNERFGRPDLMSYLWSGQAVFELLFMTLTGYWAAKFGSKSIMVIHLYFIWSSNGLRSAHVYQPHGFWGQFIPFYLPNSIAHRLLTVPVLIQGISPTIFIIPITLVMVALVIIMNVLYKEKRILKSGSLLSNR